MESETTVPSMAALFPFPPTSTVPLDDPLQAVDASLVEEKRAEAYVELFHDPGRAARLAHEALDAARFTTTPTLEAHAALTLCLARLFDDDEGADSECVAGLESLVTRSVDPRAHWLMYDARALALLREGRAEDALVELIRLMISSTDNRPARDCFLTIALLTQIHGALGNVAEGLGSAYRALSLARRTGSISLRVYALILLGERQLEQHHLTVARLAFEQALRGARRASSRHLEQRALIGLIETTVADGEPKRALELANVAGDRDRPTPALAESLALAYLANSQEAMAQRWVDVAASAGTSLRQAWVQARIDLAHGRLVDAARRCAAVVEHVAPLNPSRDEKALWATRAAVAEALGDRSAAATCRAEVERIDSALEERSAQARILSEGFESTILQAHPMCCEMIGEQSLCA